MPIKAEQLDSDLARQLRPIYLISGDETLLVEEACDAVLAAARAQGFNERSVHHVDTGFRWHELAIDASSMSLFAQRKVLDVRVPANKFDKEAGAALREWADGVSGNDDSLLLLRTGRLEPRVRSTAWFKALDVAGGVVLIWPISLRDLPGWLSRRLDKVDLNLQRDALLYLSERVEGNLLAAAQEIDKLTLMNLPQPISQQMLAQNLEDTARFGSFDLIDAAMSGQGERVRKILLSLREDGSSLFGIMGALTSQLRRMRQLRGLPPQRAQVLEQFARRGPPLAMLLAECAVIDQQGKGERFGDPWVSLEQLLLYMAATPNVLPPSRYQRRLRDPRRVSEQRKISRR